MTSLVAAVLLTVTAYCNGDGKGCKTCCGKWAGGPTASGRMPVEGRTVAASRKIPFGTRVWIEGVGVRVVEDRLSPRFDHRVDVFFRSHKEALRFGKRRLEVEVIK